MLFETSDDMFLSAYQEEEMVDNLLSGEESEGGGGGGGMSLAEALLPLVESSSSPPMPWVLSTRYKTELCSSYAATGLCKYAERCQFAHGLAELHVPSRHPKYKTELCRSYHTAGYCFYGTRCLFVHSPKEQRPARRRKRNVACRTFQAAGVCPFGTCCNFLHVEGGSNVESPDSAAEESARPYLVPVPSQPQSPSWQWKLRGPLCRTFSSFGFCLYGTRCRFQHSLPSTLKGSDPNLCPGELSPLLLSRPLSPGSDMFSMSPSCSSSCSSPPSALASLATTPLTTDPVAHNAFTFSSQHLSDLLLPLALRLQQLESSKAMAITTQSIWDSRSM